MGMLVFYARKLVEKEKIPELKFPGNDVLESFTEKEKRLMDLQHANELGDLAQYKVKILFEDSAGPKRVVTTVWNTTKKDVVLKYGITIPIKRVSKVLFT